MTRRPVARRRIVDLARIGIGISDELQNRLGRNRRIYQDDVGLAAKASDRRDVANKIEVELFVERGVDGIRGNYKEERVPVSGRAYDRLSSDIAACARSVVDDELLAEPLR